MTDLQWFRFSLLLLMLSVIGLATWAGCAVETKVKNDIEEIKGTVAAIATDVKAGRDVNNGLSSRAITVIAVVGILAAAAAYVLVRTDFKRLNSSTTHEAVTLALAESSKDVPIVRTR